jgi:hypothetical protein
MLWIGIAIIGLRVGQYLPTWVSEVDDPTNARAVGRPSA